MVEKIRKDRGTLTVKETLICKKYNGEIRSNVGGLQVTEVGGQNKM